MCLVAEVTLVQLLFSENPCNFLSVGIPLSCFLLAQAVQDLKIFYKTQETKTRIYYCLSFPFKLISVHLNFVATVVAIYLLLWFLHLQD